jgi:hypothetical protein
MGLTTFLTVFFAFLKAFLKKPILLSAIRYL